MSVDEADPGNFGSGWPRQALCGDISLHGARVEASDQLGEIGDGLYITARVGVGEIDQVMLLEGVIRNLEEIEDSFNDGFRMLHGIEFVAPDEGNSTDLDRFCVSTDVAGTGGIVSFRLGFIVNPMAGLGGSVALKGSDGTETAQRALQLGAVPRAGERALQALEVLQGLAFECITFPREMGESVAREAGIGTDRGR